MIQDNNTELALNYSPVDGIELITKVIQIATLDANADNVQTWTTTSAVYVNLGFAIDSDTTVTTVSIGGVFQQVREKQFDTGGGPGTGLQEISAEITDGVCYLVRGSEDYRSALFVFNNAIGQSLTAQFETSTSVFNAKTFNEIATLDVRVTQNETDITTNANNIQSNVDRLDALEPRVDDLETLTSIIDTDGNITTSGDIIAVDGTFVNLTADNLTVDGSPVEPTVGVQEILADTGDFTIIRRLTLSNVVELSFKYTSNLGVIGPRAQVTETITVPYLPATFTNNKTYVERTDQDNDNIDECMVIFFGEDLEANNELSVKWFNPSNQNASDVIRAAFITVKYLL